jgi:predicted DNA-binding transcriptional regulator AlpA
MRKSMMNRRAPAAAPRPAPAPGGAHHVYRTPQVLELTGWSKSTLYVKMGKGVFPRPFKPDPDGRIVTWDGPEVDAIQRRRIAQRGEPAAAAKPVLPRRIIDDGAVAPPAAPQGIRDRAGVAATAIILEIKLLLPAACRARVVAALRPRLVDMLRDEFDDVRRETMNDITTPG